MALFIEFTKGEDGPVSVNMDRATHFFPSGTGTRIYFGAESSVWVSERYDHVSQRWHSQRDA